MTAKTYETNLSSLQALDERIDFCRNALIDLPEGSDGYLDTLEQLGNLHMDRFELLSDSYQDRDEAIDIYREFCRLCPNSERRLSTLHLFAGILLGRGKLSSSKMFSRDVYRTSMDDFDEAISLEREALTLCDRNHTLYGHILGRMGIVQLETQELSHRRDGVQSLRLAVDAWPKGHLDRLEYLKKLASGLNGLLITSNLSTALDEVDEISSVYEEIAGYYIVENTKEYVEWLVKSGYWVSQICKLPENQDKAPRLLDLASKILQHDPNNTDGKQYMIVAEVSQQWISGFLTENVLHVEEPDHKILANEFIYTGTNVDHSDIIPVYDTLLPSDKERDFELSKNLHYLAQDTNKKKRDATELAALNVGGLFRKLSSVKYLKAEIHYQQWAKQLISMEHEFYPILNLNLTQNYILLFYQTQDLDDFRRSIQMSYLAPAGEGPVVQGPYFLNNPFTDDTGPYGHSIETDLQNSYFSISHTREAYERERFSSYRKETLASALFYHERKFYSMNESYFAEIKSLLQELIADGSGKIAGRTNLSSVALLQYRQSGNSEYLYSAFNTNSTLNLATYIDVLWEKFLYEGNLQDIDEAIKLSADGYDVKNLKRVDADKEANNFLGRCLNTRYFALGHEDDLTLSLDKSILTIDIAQAYLLKYQKFGHVEDLDQVFENRYFETEAMRLAEKAESFDYYEDHRRKILHAYALNEKYKVENDAELLQKATSNLEKCRSTCPRSLQPRWIHCYITLLLEEPFTTPEQLDDAIGMCKEGLDRLLNQSIFFPLLKYAFGKLRVRQYDATGDIKYLSASLQAFREANLFLKPGSSNSDIIHFDLGTSLKMMAKTENAYQFRIEAIEAFQIVCESPTSTFELRYKASVEWAKLAEGINPKDALQAYEYVMNVLPHLASLSLDVKNRHQRLIKLSLRGISGDAAACAIEAGNIEKAVEFLEHGRSIFWQQAMNLRTSVETLQDIDPKLAKELATLARELNISGFHTQFQKSSNNYQKFLNRESSKRIALADKWSKLLEQAQSLPGCETLLKPMPYSKLAYSASRSIVVLLSITDRTTHAIVMKTPKSPPTSLELPQVNRSRAERMAITLQAILKGNNLREVTPVIESNERSGRLLVPFNAGLGEKKMHTILWVLWADIVKPVLEFVDLKPTDKPVRITWCCTDILATLPIHAAGVYHGPNQENLFQYAISSYTSTLSSLLSSASPIAMDEVQVLLAGMEKASGYPTLPNVVKEVHYVQNSLKDARTETLINSEATRNRLLENMGSAHLVHLACHGIASPNPLESAIVLHDGQLKIDKLMRTPFKNANLVFLSACQTAKINPLEADESIHIASAMLSTGFKSVIATLWSIDDGDAPVVAKAFYRNLIRDAKIDVQDSALALHHAISELRKTGVSPLRWVPFIHMGL